MFKNLFFQTKALPELSSQLDTEIPRYPPFLKGLPAASSEDLQSTQDELIAKLRQALAFNQRDFQRLIQPCIDHLFKLNMRIEQFLKQFIFAQADDLLSDVVDVPDDALASP